MTITTMRVRITMTPPANECDEYPVHHLRTGHVYELSARLAELLVLSGYAVPESESSSQTERKYR
jgi:hypothetical protein